MTTDYSALSDEELDALINASNPTTAAPGAGSQALATRNSAVAEKQERAPKPQAEQIEPSAWNRAMAALGGAAMEPVLGAVEKFQMLFPQESTFKDIAAARTDRRGIQRQLEETTAGKIGAFGGKALPAFVLPQTIPAQTLGMGALGFLEGGPDEPTGAWNEFSSSAFKGATDAAATALAMKGVQTAGKAINAAHGKLSAEGAKAMELDDAAARLGLPKPTIGQLDPHTPAPLQAHPDLLKAQVAVLDDAMALTRNVPKPGGGTESQRVPGGQLKVGLEDAINARRAQAKDMYSAVDQFAQANGLGGVPANYTVNVLQSANKLTPSGKSPTGNNIVYNLLDNYDPDAFAWLKQAGSVKAARQGGMTMAQYHDARVATGKALNSLMRKNPADLTADQLEARSILMDLKKALDNDVAVWAKANAGNEEAVGLYNRAKDFYATTFADAVIDNPVARKVASKTRPFQSAEQMYNALINPSNQSLVDRLLPTADQRTKDILNVLRNLPGAGQAVAGRSVAPAGRGAIGLQEALTATGHPLLALGEYAPGLQWISSQRPTKLLHFAATPTTRALGPSAQYPAGGLEQWARQKSATTQDRR